MPKIEQKISDFFAYIKTNGNIEKLGTNADNRNENIHRWFSFLPGFSHLFVKTTIEYFKTKKENGNLIIFDPFMGSATTAVVGKQLGINVIGNESNKFLYKIGKAKIHQIAKPEYIEDIKKIIIEEAKTKWKKQDISKENDILSKCYSRGNLKKLVALRNICISDSVPDRYKLYFFVAISSLLPKCSNVGISIPYISWSHTRKAEEPFKLFENMVDVIKNDLLKTKKPDNNKASDIYLHDSRCKNIRINNDSVDIVFTSPPYLNNFDYGEALKVYTYFWGITENWREITEKVRKKSLTSATTHYKEKEYVSKTTQEMLGDEMVSAMPNVVNIIANKIELIQKAKSKKDRKKSFDILTALYFKDMYEVLKEVYRVLKVNSLCFMIIGDSAPYGVYIPTDEILGKIGAKIGFSKYSLETLRLRGRKWLNLKHRHKVKLRESLLILRK
jgi:DNA modification methylase